MKDILYEAWLTTVLPAGGSEYKKLFKYFSEPYDIYRADEAELEAAGASAKLIYAMRKKDLNRAAKISEYCNRQGIELITCFDKRYPQRLASIQSPPFAIYLMGKMPDIDYGFNVAVVGTRKMSEYGMKSAYKISYELAAAGARIISGMALGIDSVAACAALEAGGSTVAVLGCGLDRTYPPQHEKLMHIIAENGAVFSEFPPGTPPLGTNFPIRNRIMSGLSQSILVVEAGDGSGALITAKAAISQGRVVYAIPGHIDSPTSVGVNSLIQSGVRIALSSGDILEDANALYSGFFNEGAYAYAQSHSAYRDGVLEKYGVASVNSNSAPAAVKREKKAPTPMVVPERQEDSAELPKISSDARRVLEYMPKGEAVPVDFFEGLEISSAKLTRILFGLELSGAIQSAPGGSYVRLK
jgi:DNA processing protein